MSDPMIATERLVLRRFTMEDAPAMHRVFSDPLAMRYWSTRPHETLAVTETWIGITVSSVAVGDSDDFAVVLNGSVIGKAGLWKGSEVGIILARETWALGYATEALTAVIDRTFAGEMSRIDADIDPLNTASLKLFEKLGFRQVGFEKATFLVDEVWSDSLYLVLTPSDWSSR